ncbi:MAG TPA: PVC-type heme-binding CxxCH protein [Pirellulales bacterium]|nr:PVC-type heme-binding CxxCH protein [Pirellulales bacterium]
MRVAALSIAWLLLCAAIAPAAEDETETRSAAEGLASMKPRPGFSVELVAAEPLVMDPVAFAWGADGKLWVVEMADYPRGIDGRGKFGGRVRFLEDIDADGRYDTSTVFLDGLGYPNGVMPWRKGVLVTCAPEVFYAEDTDGDGRADLRRTLYKGFAEGNQQHRTNGLRYGLDNWIYCANGDSGGQVESVATGERVAISGRDFRIRPDDGAIEAQTGQTQFVREPNDWGDWFGSNNSNPLYQFVLDEHYLRRNAHVSPPEARVQVSLAPGAAPVFPASRTELRFNDLNAANRFTSACSAILYRDELFGPGFYGNSFVCEPVHNLVHREVLHAEGVLFRSQRAPDERLSEFLASTDNWSRPVMVRCGPDGALWVADMYRQVIEHPEWIPKEWQQKLDLRAGHDKGRIYRVFPADKRPRSVPRLDRLDATGLVAALDSPSGWQRDMVQQLLIHRADQAALPLLKAMLEDRQQRPLARLHALCTLDGLGALDAETLSVALGDPQPGVVRHAVRLCEPLLDEQPGLAAALVELVSSEDAPLRLQLAYSLGEWHSAAAGQALGRLALAAPDDPYITAAVLSSANPKNLQELLAAVLSSPFAPRKDVLSLSERRHDLLASLVNMAVATDDFSALAVGVEAIVRREHDCYAVWQLAALDGLMDSLGRRKLSLTEFRNRAPRELKAPLGRLDDVFAYAWTIAVDETAGEADRIAAVRLLARRPERYRESDIDALAELLSPQTPGALQAAAIDALARLDEPRIAALLLAGWKGHGPERRGQIVDRLSARGAGVQALLDQIAAGAVAPAEIDAARRQRLLTHADANLRTRAEQLLAGAVNPDRQKIVEQYRAALKLSGDPAQGAAVFKKACSQCHRLGDVGHAVGPDLTALTDKSPESLLVAVFDPNRAVEAKFLNYSAVTADGIVHTGMLGAETSASITLLASEGKQVSLLRKDLEAFEGSSKSLMPEGLEKDLPPRDVADLLRYLGAFKPARKQFAGNQPALVRPEALRGELWLLAADAEIYGQTLVFEPNYRNLGYWNSHDDHAAWTIEIERPGVYAVSLDYACADGTAGQTIAVEAAGGRVTGQVTGTGNWDTYRQKPLGRLELPAGKHELVVRPEGPLRGPLIDLKAVRLVPGKKE